jgi:hypothetical protein
MRRLLRQARLLAALAIFFALPTLVASAAAPPGEYFNGFEVNPAGWFNFSGGTIHREPSGYVSSNMYATGVPSAAGDWHARLGIDPSPDSCASGGGPQPIHYGPYTNWGGYSSFFPPGGYVTRVDVYLDVAWAGTHFDRRFDWASAVNTPSGSHRRDFVFNVGTEPTGFVISGSNNSTRCGAFPANPGRTPVHVMASGWYTFEHTFTGLTGGPLAVNMRLINKSTSATVGTWVLSDATDIIGSTVGGNRYGWFVQNEIDELAIDNSQRTGIVSTPGCEIKINDGGSITALNTDKATFGGNAKVSASRDTSGSQTYHDHGPVQPLDMKSLTVEAVICDDDRTTAEIYGSATVEGLPGEHEYRIKLQDNGEGVLSTGDMYGIEIPSAFYASGYRTLDGGNIQIR